MYRRFSRQKTQDAEEEDEMDPSFLLKVNTVDRLRVGWLNGFSFIWEGYHESRRCSRDTYPESYITNDTRIRR